MQIINHKKVETMQTRNFFFAALFVLFFCQLAIASTSAAAAAAAAAPKRRSLFGMLKNESNEVEVSIDENIEQNGGVPVLTESRFGFFGRNRKSNQDSDTDQIQPTSTKETEETASKQTTNFNRRFGLFGRNRKSNQDSDTEQIQPTSEEETSVHEENIIETPVDVVEEEKDSSNNEKEKTIDATDSVETPAEIKEGSEGDDIVANEETLPEEKERKGALFGFFGRNRKLSNQDSDTEQIQPTSEEETSVHEDNTIETPVDVVEEEKDSSNDEEEKIIDATDSVETPAEIKEGSEGDDIVANEETLPEEKERKGVFNFFNKNRSVQKSIDQNEDLQSDTESDAESKINDDEVEGKITTTVQKEAQSEMASTMEHLIDEEMENSEEVNDIENSSESADDAEPQTNVEILQSNNEDVVESISAEVPEMEEKSDKESASVSSLAEEFKNLVEKNDDEGNRDNLNKEEATGSDDGEKEARKKEKKRKFRFGQALSNAFPWAEKKNETESVTETETETKDSDNSEESENQFRASNSTSGRNPIQSTDPTMPLGQPNSPLILFAPPPSFTRSQPMQMPMSPNRRIPQSPTDITIASLVNALLPLLSRLLLLTLLSGSALLGNDNNIYSPEPSQHFMLERVNERYEKDSMAMKKALETPPRDTSKRVWSFANNRRKSALKKQIDLEDKAAGKVSTKASKFARTVIILEVQTFNNDMDTVVENLRDSVSFILAQYNDKKKRLDMGEQIEIVVCIESPGGVVQDFGLAADQLKRLKEVGMARNDLLLTVCVDKIAASGGYMMACQASPGQLIAAPFSVIGSIGVLREVTNIHDVLEKYGVRPLLLKAGNAKVPLTQTTKVTEESIAIVQKNLDKVHEAFRELVSDARGESISENFEDVTNGDIFLGKDAAELGLIDRVMTSDEYISEKVQKGDRVLRLHKYDRSRAGLRLSPLDLLLLKSNGLLGKHVTAALKNSIQIFSKVMRVGATMGMVKLLDVGYQMSYSRLRPEDNI